MTKILLTGATGYLGGHLSKKFFSEGYNIIALCLNKSEEFNYSPEFKNQVKVYYLDKTPLEKIFEENNIDIIIHTATSYGRNQESISDLIKVNVIFPVEILTLACDYKVKTFINTDSILTKNISNYSMTKSHLADWLEIFSDKIKCINLKLDHFYGPNDKPIKFIAWLIEQFKSNVKEINLTEGSQTRDFIYIDDVVEAYDCIIKNLDSLSNNCVSDFEVGTNIKTTIKQLVLDIKELTNNTETKTNFGALPYRKNEVLDYEIDTVGLRMLGWVPKISIKEGLERIIKEKP
jgi:CDP-paratose synthetase